MVCFYGFQCNSSAVCESLKGFFCDLQTAWRLVLSMKPWSYIWLEIGLFSTIIYIYILHHCISKQRASLAKISDKSFIMIFPRHINDCEKLESPLRWRIHIQNKNKRYYYLVSSCAFIYKGLHNKLPHPPPSPPPLFGVKPLSKPMLDYCQLHPQKHTSVKF